MKENRIKQLNAGFAKHRKKIIIVIGAVLSVILCVGVFSALTAKADYYESKVTNEGTTDEGYWKVKGATDAPDDYYVVAVSRDDNEDPSQLITSSDGDPVIVHNGRFTGEIDPTFPIDNYTDGEKADIFIAAVSPDEISEKEKADLTTDVPVSVANEAKNNGTEKEFTLSQDQIDLLDLENDSDSDDSEETDSEETDEDEESADDELPTPSTFKKVDLVTFERRFKSFLYKGVQISGLVESVQVNKNEEGAYLISISDSNYDHEIVASVSAEVMDSLSYRIVEDDWVIFRGIAIDGFTTTNASGATSDMPGVEVTKIKLIQ